ncbi:hypothetical protein [Bradyrhizobium sp. CCBAU 51753]|uniref:hypothetical protein n=1 Tax=Bradyrhizobium sp. CCBAU 51753 TaxID=1325100 RepID=UPI001FEFD925|nr:hypothetical protein [Bradyrhizobium sp. CCBAU 51753]
MPARHGQQSRDIVAAGQRDDARSRNLCLADSPYSVVGNHATGRCPIVRTNPVIDGDNWFGDEPLVADAKLARSTVGACPKDELSREDDDGETR